MNVGGCEWGSPAQGDFSPDGCPTLSDGTAGEHLTDWLTDAAVGLIERSDGRPFFLNFWIYAAPIPI